MRKLTQLVDYFVIASGTSRRQIHTIADEIDHAMNLLGDEKIGIEGYDESHWTLVDYGDVVVHLFDEETRRYYDLENLWGDAPRVELPETQDLITALKVEPVTVSRKRPQATKEL